MLVTSLVAISLFIARGPGEAGVAFVATVGSILLTWWVRRRYTRKSGELEGEYEKWRGSGDYEVWPYLLRGEFDGVVGLEPD